VELDSRFDMEDTERVMATLGEDWKEWKEDWKEWKEDSMFERILKKWVEKMV
jgi:hypothetical protein